MTENTIKPVPKRYGKIIYDTNPSVTGEFKTNVRRAINGNAGKALMITKGNGEIIAHGDIAFIEEKEVDSEEFIKLYLAGITQFGELGKPGALIFSFVYHQIVGLTGKDKDTVVLNYLLAQRWKEDLQRRTYERGMKELLDKGFLFMTVATDMYFVNVRFLFNGDRLALAKVYTRKSDKKPKLDHPKDITEEARDAYQNMLEKSMNSSVSFIKYILEYMKENKETVNTLESKKTKGIKDFTNISSYYLAVKDKASQLATFNAINSKINHQNYRQNKTLSVLSVPY